MTFFWKCEGAGNDFIVFDEAPSTLSPSFIQKVCHRRYGIGADGVLLWGLLDTARYFFRIFNADGGEAHMCGNGLRCIAEHIAQRWHHTAFSIVSRVGEHRCFVRDGRCFVEIAEPKWIESELSLEPGLPTVAVVDTGVPHAVYEGPWDLDQARALRHHPYFGEEGVNVSCITDRRAERLFLHTYERGVEAETLSCGTGAAAAFAVCAPGAFCSAIFPQGDTIEQCLEDGRIFQSGRVSFLFSGTLSEAFFTLCQGAAE